jgi:hypothetical protein|tara:strand:- start:42 stop:395 length:354 start_codon:yes stop_codon:yes gene_type:complete
METIDDDSIVGSMTHILNDYKLGGGYLDGDSKEIWQQLQTSINNFGNNKQMKEEYPNVLTGGQHTWLLNQLDNLGEDWLSLVRNVISRGKYSDWEQNELNELRKLVKTKKNDFKKII